MLVMLAVDRSDKSLSVAAIRVICIDYEDCSGMSNAKYSTECGPLVFIAYSYPTLIVRTALSCPAKLRDVRRSDAITERL